MVRWVLVAGTAAVAMLLASPAQAERSDVRDGTGDVWSPEGARDWTHEGSVVNTDLTGVVVDHRADALVVTASYVELRKRASDEVDLDLSLRTSGGRLFSVYVQEDWLFRSMFVPVLDVETQERVDCPGATGTGSAARDTITFSVPTSCLDDPEWLRFQLQARSYSESRGLFLDDARSDRPEPRTWSRRLRAG